MYLADQWRMGGVIQLLFLLFSLMNCVNNTYNFLFWSMCVVCDRNY